MYEAEISRSNPALLLFLFDCSYSMTERYGSSNLSKGEYLAKICNESIDQVILSIPKFNRDDVEHISDFILNYFQMESH